MHLGSAAVNPRMPSAAELDALLETHLPTAARAWLAERLAAVAAGGLAALAPAFGQAARRCGKALLPGGWSCDQAARVRLVLALPAEEPRGWLAALDRLFATATGEELVALYQGLPLYPHPGRLVARCAEGIRSSMTPVFRAVACGNPFPAEHLDQAAWNQMVLKVFFTGSEAGQVLGLERRANPALGAMLLDYARERRAAGRPIDPALLPLARLCCAGDEAMLAALATVG